MKIRVYERQKGINYGAKALFQQKVYNENLAESIYFKRTEEHNGF